MTTPITTASAHLEGPIVEDPYHDDRYYIGAEMHDVHALIASLSRDVLDYVADDGGTYTVELTVKVEYEDYEAAPTSPQSFVTASVGVPPASMDHSAADIVKREPKTRVTRMKRAGEVTQAGMEYYLFADGLRLPLSEEMGMTLTKAFAPFVGTQRSVVATFTLSTYEA